MKILRAVAMAAMVVTPALAQSPNVNLIPDLPSKTPEQIERDQQLQKAYRESLRKIPDAKASNDPWGSMRGSEAPASAATHRAKPKAKPRGAGTAQ
ncbi:MAG: hypothetical protein M9932_03480 [Xanthobacteraceae bacterium]|nr:hypothetical protein [Xanthobacteraceae bacterium]